MTRADYDRTPVKPVLDGEPIYEDHPVSFDAKRLGHSIAADVRRPLYWNLFTGAFGHTYGHHSVWQMWTPGQDAGQQPADAVVRGDRPAGRGADAARARPARVAAVPHAHPGPTSSSTGAIPTNIPGAGRYDFAPRATPSGTYAMVYAPVGRTFTVQMNAITGPTVKAWWFNPRNGDGDGDRHVPEHGRARLHAAGRRRDARLGAGARRRGEALSAPGVEGRRLERGSATARLSGTRA